MYKMESRNKMKSLSIAILGVVAAWFVIGLLTQNFEANMLIGITIGAFLGYSVRKDTEKRKDRALHE